jgi:hypothetical protein
MPDNLLTSPVIVPANFVGVCTSDIVNAPAAIHHGLVRSWDYNGSNGYLTGTCVMTNINPSSGVYNWATFDQLLSNNPTKQIIICLGAVPDYLVLRAANGSSYKGIKGNMVPDNLAGWVTAITAVVSRAKNMHGRTGLLWQLWNEIDQLPSFNDTISLLGPYAKATSQTIKAVDPTAKVLSPSIAGPSATTFPYITGFAAASDGSGGTAMQWVDGMSLHYYNQAVSQLSQFESPLNYVCGFKSFQGALANVGCYLPIYITETGVIAADTNGWRAYQRRMLSYAALGAKSCLMYSYDTSLYPMSAYVTQFNLASDLLIAGSAITSFIPGMATMQITINGYSYTF